MLLHGVHGTVNVITNHSKNKHILVTLSIKSKNKDDTATRNVFLLYLTGLTANLVIAVTTRKPAVEM